MEASEEEWINSKKTTKARVVFYPIIQSSQYEFWT